MQNLFGNSYESYIGLLQKRWCKIILSSYASERVCLIGKTKCQELFYNNDSLCIELSNSKQHNKVITCYDQLPLHSDFFDLVVSFQAHEDADDYNLSLEEMSRILSSQGVLVCFSFMEMSNNYTLPYCSMSLIREVPILYRPKYKKLFNKLFFLEILGPFILPFCNKLNITIWQKNAIFEQAFAMVVLPTGTC